MNKQPQITAQTRQTFIDTFLTLNQTTEIQKITINQICQQAHYNRSTFYQYFADIYDLRSGIENDLLHELEQLFNAHLSQCYDENPLTLFLNFYSRHADPFLILLGPNGDPCFYQKIKNTLKPAIYQILALDDQTLENDYIIEFTMSAMISTVTYWFQNNQNLPIPQLSNTLYTIIATGILPLLHRKK